MGVLLVMQCLVTAGSVTKCDNFHCCQWKIFGWCDPHIYHPKSQPRVVVRARIFSLYLIEIRGRISSQNAYSNYVYGLTTPSKWLIFSRIDFIKVSLVIFTFDYYNLFIPVLQYMYIAESRIR